MSGGSDATASGCSTPRQEADRVDNQRIALPFTDGMSIDGWHKHGRVRVLPPIQIDMSCECVNLRHLDHFIRCLHDVPRCRMLHKKRIVERLAPFRAKGNHIACLLPGCLPSIGFDKLGLESSFGNNLFEDSSEAAPSDVVHSLPGSREVPEIRCRLRE